MRTIYLECGMGAAGDMLTAALLGLLDDPQPFLDAVNSAGIPGVAVALTDAEQAGIRGLQMRVTVNGVEEHSHDAHGHHHHDDEHHHHNHHDEEQHHHQDDEHHHHSHHHAKLEDIAAMIRGLNLPEAVREKSVAVYTMLAEAESAVHGKPVGEIHFHEVGTADAVADIVGVCLLMEWLKPERVLASPVHVGSGHVHCAHGFLPVPAPATAYLLRGIPCYGGEIEGELCTPTGAALLKYFVDEFVSMPAMRTEKISYGLGKKVFPKMNAVRAFLGETESSPAEICELRCNLDDMTGEAIGFAQEILLAAGARDVFTTPVTMKKGRPGILLTVLCDLRDRDTMLRLIFRHTTTLGVRETLCSRYTLERETETAHTADGVVRIKHATGYGVTRTKPEYDDIAAIARAKGCALSEVNLTETEEKP